MKVKSNPGLVLVLGFDKCSKRNVLRRRKETNLLPSVKLSCIHGGNIYHDKSKWNEAQLQ